MKPLFCRFEISTVASILAIMDILRAMFVSGLLIGLFCGMGTVNLKKLPEKVYDETKRVDYHRNREILVACIVIGVAICGVDILMALALDNILQKNLKRASLVWINFALLGILVRGGFYVYLWKRQEHLGFHRLNELTPSVELISRILFLGGVGYEMVKVVQLITAVAAFTEFRGNDHGKKQGAPKRVAVGMIGGSKRWDD